MKVTQNNFEESVIQSDVPVLCDFYADWCGPCRAITPILEQLEAESNGEYKIAKIKYDEAMEIAAQYKVDALPTLILFEGGVATRCIKGSQTKARLAKFIKEG